MSSKSKCAPPVEDTGKGVSKIVMNEAIEADGRVYFPATIVHPDGTQTPAFFVMKELKKATTRVLDVLYPDGHSD